MRYETRDYLYYMHGRSKSGSTDKYVPTTNLFVSIEKEEKK